jgi:putative salt-induced outer membrane protein YdiY
MIRNVWLLLMPLFFQCISYADTVLIENGDILTGSVVSISGGQLVLSSDYADNIVIDMTAISQIETDGSFDLMIKNNRLKGRLRALQGVALVVTAQENIPFELQDLRFASQSKLRTTKLMQEWNSRVDLAFEVSSGNSKTESYNTLVESDLKRDNVEHNLALLINTEDSEGLKTKDQLDLDYGLKLFISDQWYSALNAEYFSDPLKDVDLRITLGVGAGYQFTDNSFGALSTELGVSAVQEELNGDEEVNPAIRWGVDYNRYFLSQRLEFFHRQNLLIIPAQDRGQVLSSSTGLRFALNHRIDTAFRVDLNYETEPTAGNNKLDTSYSLGLGIRF